MHRVLRTNSIYILRDGIPRHTLQERLQRRIGLGVNAGIAFQGPLCLGRLLSIECALNVGLNALQGSER